ncbi:DUF354 domain-containing protein [Methanoregula formicica]|uniref:DUF354 domain-containing protein n=1 Tax=Methanoregula formicica (strain DSM 22288 / NBRC 105244 / SMSP) TaxID=593750 RepID=L0HEI5_METFS|nr:DUF354 domain-containing protein [Methanoregula formicica]AGB02440.1 hypothetical protein Metfor_1402 [Methanoregula formicica SMSP]
MKILIDISHPGHVHLFKNFIWEMKRRGHEILVTARDKDVVIQLLEAYDIPFQRVGKKGSSRFNLVIELVQREIEIFRIARIYNPDFFIGLFNPAIAHVATLLHKPSMNFIDSEPEVVKFADLITIPFSNIILTLNSVKHNFGSKEIRINSFKELASLHPNYFSPNFQTIESVGIKEPDSYAVIRFVSWGAYHDIGQNGFNNDEKHLLIKQLEKYLPVYISSESQLPKDLEKYRMPIPPEKIHDFLYFAKFLVSDSQTMTTESAVLGTPAIRYNSFVGQNDMGNFIELEKKYCLIFNYKNSYDAIQKAVDLAQIPNIKQIWKPRKELLLKDKVNITAFMVWFIDAYPQSVMEMRNNPDLQYLWSPVTGETL